MFVSNDGEENDLSFCVEGIGFVSRTALGSGNCCVSGMTCGSSVRFAGVFSFCVLGLVVFEVVLWFCSDKLGKFWSLFSGGVGYAFFGNCFVLFFFFHNIFLFSTRRIYIAMVLTNIFGRRLGIC